MPTTHTPTGDFGVYVIRMRICDFTLQNKNKIFYWASFHHTPHPRSGHTKSYVNALYTSTIYIKVYQINIILKLKAATWVWSTWTEWIFDTHSHWHLAASKKPKQCYLHSSSKSLWKLNGYSNKHWIMQVHLSTQILIFWAHFWSGNRRFNWFWTTMFW